MRKNISHGFGECLFIEQLLMEFFANAPAEDVCKRKTETFFPQTEERDARHDKKQRQENWRCFCQALFFEKDGIHPSGGKPRTSENSRGLQGFRQDEV